MIHHWLMNTLSTYATSNFIFINKITIFSWEKKTYESYFTTFKNDKGVLPHPSVHFPGGMMTSQPPSITQS